MAAPEVPGPVVLIWGDEHGVARRAREVFRGWGAADAGAEEEVIAATASNSDEVSRAVARLREALQTLPFFGGSKSIWWRDCSFLGDDRVSESQGVLDTLADLGRELAAFRWEGVRLLVTAAKMDRRRAFYKALEKLATVEHLPGLTADDRDWREKACSLVAAEMRTLGKRLRADALEALVDRVGPQARQLAAEAEKLAAYVGERGEVEVADVRAVVTGNRQARAFALADALGERRLGRVLGHLEDELWAMQSDRQKSEIGLLYALISKVRAMLLVQELQREGLIRPGVEYAAFAAQLKRLPEERLATDRRFNPAAINAYVLYRAAQHAANYTRGELVAAMEELLRCNRRLVGSGVEGRLALQVALVRILRPGETAARRDSDRGAGLKAGGRGRMIATEGA